MDLFLKWTSPKAYWDDLVTESTSLPFIHIMMLLLIEQKYVCHL